MKFIFIKKVIKMLLSQLQSGDKCSVTELTADSILKQKMITMGILPGVEIEIVKFAPLGDPIEIKMNNANLSLRKQEADQILVSKIDTAKTNS